MASVTASVRVRVTDKGTPNVTVSAVVSISDGATVKVPVGQKAIRPTVCVKGRITDSVPGGVTDWVSVIGRCRGWSSG